MKSTQIPASNPRLELRLAAYAAAGVALAAPALTPNANAAVIYSGPLTLAVPANSGGIYINFVTGVTGTSSFTGYDFNPYLSTNLKFFESTTYSDGIVGTGTAASALTPVTTTVSSASTFLTSVVNGTPAFTGTGVEYAGVRFLNETTGATDYGWVAISTTTGTGFPATIVGYGYENTGAPIIVGAVPEPTTTAILGLGALCLGAAGVRRWRQARQAMV